LLAKKLLSKNNVKNFNHCLSEEGSTWDKIYPSTLLRKTAVGENNLMPCNLSDERKRGKPTFVGGEK
jgi:hypothetical protein